MKCNVHVDGRQANAAAKKRDGRAAAYQLYLGLAAALVNALYLALQLIWLAQPDDNMWRNLGVHTVLTVPLYLHVVSSERQGIDSR